MLFDDVAVVVLGAESGNESGLSVAAHYLSIQIHAGGVLAYKVSAVDEFLEIFLGVVVNRLRISLGAFGQFDFRTDDSHKAKRLAFGLSGRLFKVHDIVRKAGYCGSLVGGWS